MSFVMSYPYTSPTTSLTLRNPQFGDRLEINQGVIHRETRAGDAKPVHASGWLETVNRAYSFQALTRTEVDALRTFLQTSLSDEYRIVDHLGETWKVITATEDLEIITIRDTCSFDVEFQVIGEKV